MNTGDEKTQHLWHGKPKRVTYSKYADPGMDADHKSAPAPLPGKEAPNLAHAQIRHKRQLRNAQAPPQRVPVPLPSDNAEDSM